MNRAVRATFILAILAMLVGWVALAQENRELGRAIQDGAQVQVRR